MKAEEALKISKNHEYISPEQEEGSKILIEVERIIEIMIFPWIKKQAELGRTMITLTQTPFTPPLKYIGDVLRTKYGYRVEKKWWGDKLIVSWDNL